MKNNKSFEVHCQETASNLLNEFNFFYLTKIDFDI